MQVYEVMVWDTNWNVDDPDDWTMEFPPVRVTGFSSQDAAFKVAGHEELDGIRRPRGWTGMLFQDRDMGLVFHVEDLGRAAPTYEEPEWDETWKVKTTKYTGRYEEPYRYGEKDVRVQRMGPHKWREV